MFFQDFLEEELVMIISLPVRTGIWMSHMDDIDTTDRDDLKERLVLENVLKSLSRQKNATPFISALAEDALAHRDYWPQWTDKDTQELLFRDIGTAVHLIDARLPVEQARNFKRMLIQIADAVAHAYDEHIGEGDDLREELFLGGLVTRIMDRLDTKIDMDNPDHVSAAEASALQKLKSTLKL